MLNMEQKIMMQMAPNETYDFLSHPHKLEVLFNRLAPFFMTYNSMKCLFIRVGVRARPR